MSLAKRKIEENPMAHNYESRLTRLETIMEFINGTLAELKNGQANIIGQQQMLHDQSQMAIYDLDKKMNIVGREIDNKVDSLRKETWSQTRWTLGFIFAVLASPHAADLVQKIAQQFTST